MFNEFLFRNGYHCPKAYNPADFLIGVLAKTNDDRTSHAVATKLCDAYDAQCKNQLSGNVPDFDEIDESKFEIQKPFWLFTIYWLCMRNLLIVLRDPSIQKIRIVQKIVSSVLFHPMQFVSLTLLY